MIKVETPSRICLFGEHQDYLGLEVIASAINLHFSTKAVKRNDSILNIKLRDRSIGELGAKNAEGKYEEYTLDVSQTRLLQIRHQRLKTRGLFHPRR